MKKKIIFVTTDSDKFNDLGKWKNYLSLSNKKIYFLEVIVAGHKGIQNLVRHLKMKFFQKQ